MPHFYFPASELEPLTTGCRSSDQTVTILHRNYPINLDLVWTFAPSTEDYDFRSHAKAREVDALFRPVHVIVFRPLVGSNHIWCFGDEISRDAELRALVKHLGGRADQGE